jgi:hypothetical protein
MNNGLQTVTLEQVIELAQTLPDEKLTSWYEYGLFIQSRIGEQSGPSEDDEAEAFRREMAAWDAAADEDWLKMERLLEEQS